MAPCDFKRTYDKKWVYGDLHERMYTAHAYFISQSKAIAAMIHDFLATANSQCTSDEQRLKLIECNVQQHYYVRLFEKMDWRNSTILDIHRQLLEKLLQTCQIVDQTAKAKDISLKILQLELRPDTWKKLQFDHISMFPDMRW